MDALEIIWELDVGIDGLDTNPANPLSRAIENLMEDGKPFKRLILCFWNERHNESESAMLHWFCAFVLSNKGRIVCFPGILPVTGIQRVEKNRVIPHEKFKLDHITLEPDLLRWHVTTQKRIKHLGGFCTTDLGLGRKLWFGISLSSISSLLPVYKKTTVRATVPSTDSRRRGQVFMDARHEAKYQILELFANGTSNPQAEFHGHARG